MIETALLFPKEYLIVQALLKNGFTISNPSHTVRDDRDYVFCDTMQKDKKMYTVSLNEIHQKTYFINYIFLDQYTYGLNRTLCIINTIQSQIIDINDIIKIITNI